MTLNAGAAIGSATSSLEIGVGGVLSATAQGSIFLVSPQPLTIQSLNAPPGETVTVTSAGLTTLFSAGLTNDTVTLDGGTGGLIMQLPTGSPLDFGTGAVLLIGDSMNLNGPAGSLKSTAPLVVRTKTNDQSITVGGSGGSGFDLTTSSINALAPGFSSITIGGLSFANQVTVGGNATFTSATTIIGSSFADPSPVGTVATSGTLPLTLHAVTGAMGSAAAPVLVNAGGNLSLIADAPGGLADIYATSAHALTLGQNVALTTGTGRDTVVLATSAGDFTVPASFTDNDDLALAPAGDLTLADGNVATEAALSLNAGGALVTGPTTLLVTTVGDMTLQCGTGSIGSGGTPVQVRVAGSLNLTAANSAFITSAAPLALGNLSVVNNANITTTGGGMTVAGSGTVGGTATLTSAGAFLSNGSLMTGSLVVTAASSITGSGLLDPGDMTLNASTVINLSDVAVTGQLNGTAPGNIFITSPNASLTVATLSSTPGHTVDVTTTGGGVLTTLFGSGLSGDAVTLDGGTGGLVMQLPTGAPLDFGRGAVTLVGDSINLDGPAGSLKSTGPLVVQTKTDKLQITIGGSGGSGLELTADSLSTLDSFKNITIGGKAFDNAVTIGGGSVAFTSPTTIIGVSFTDPADAHTLAQGTLVTSSGISLTLQALYHPTLGSGTIGSAALPVLVNVGGTLNLNTAGVGVGNIYVGSAQPLSVGENVVVTTHGRNTVLLSTSAGAGIAVNTPFSASESSDDWTLQSSGGISIGSGLVVLSAASLSLNAGAGALSVGTADLQATLGDLTLMSAGASIGSSSQPVQVSATAGSLNIATSSPTLGSADAYVTSTGKVSVGSLTAGAAGSIVNIVSTSPGGVTLATGNSLNANVTITSAGPVVVGNKGVFQAASITINATGAGNSISGPGMLATSAGAMTLNSGAGIGTSSVPLSVNVGGNLNVQAAQSVYVTSPGHDLIIAGLSAPAGQTIVVSTAGGGLLSTLSGSGFSIAGDKVTLNGSTGGITLGVRGGLDIGNGTLTLMADRITMIGPANSLSGTGNIVIESYTGGRVITLGGPAGGPGLELTADSLSVLAPGFQQTAIGYFGDNPVTTAGPVTFSSPTYILATSISDSYGVATTNGADLTLDTTTGNIDSTNLNVSGTLNLVLEADFPTPAASINVQSAQPIVLGQNTLISTENGVAETIQLTSAKITVPEDFGTQCNLILQSAGDITIGDGVDLLEDSMTLNAAGAIITGPNTKLETFRNLTLISGTRALGTPLQPLNVNVFGTLTVTSGSTDPVQIVSSNSLTLGKIETGHGASVTFLATGGPGANLTLGAGSLLYGPAVLEAASHLVLGDGDPFQAASFILLGPDGISGGRALQANGTTFASGASGAFAVIDDESGDIGSPSTPVELDSLAGGSADLTCSNGNVYVKTSGTLPLTGASAGSNSTATLASGDFVALAPAALAGNVALVTNGTLDVGTYNILVSSLSVNGGTILNSGGGSITATAGTLILGGEVGGVTGLVDIQGNAQIDGDNVGLSPDVQAGELIISPGATVGTVTIDPVAGVEISAPPQNIKPVDALAIDVNGEVSLDPMVLNTTNLALNAGSTLHLLTNSGTTPGSGYDQIVVSGPVSIASANLDFTFAAGFTPGPGTVFDIIQNNGGSAINGTFNGLPEGGVFTTGGVSLEISYVGGTSGHDVTLTVVGAPPTVTSITPSLSGGTLAPGTTSLQVTFNEPVVGANQITNYQLQSAGPDDVLGTGDDVAIPITTATFSDTTATLTFPALAEGLYRLTVDSTITDPTGIALDGTGAGKSGVNYVADFVTTAASTVSYSSSNFTLSPLQSSLGAGELVGNPSAGYDVLSQLQVAGTDYAPTGAPTFTGNPQDFVTATETMAGLNVSRDVTVPTSGSRTIEMLQNPTGGDITTSVTITSNLGTASAANVFATATGGATPSVNDQWVGTQSPGGPAIIHYIHGPAGLTPTAVNVVANGIQWTYSVTVPGGQTVKLAEFSILNSTQAGAVAAANALVSSTGFGGDAGDFLSASDLAALANFQFLAPPTGNAGGPYTLKEGSALTLDASQSSDGNGFGLNYSWTINGQANAASGVNPTLTYAQLQALGISLNGTYEIDLQVNDGHGSTATASTTLTVVVGDPAKLAFEPTINNATAGKTIPSLNVDVLDSLGALVSTDTSTVTVAITTPNGATFSAGTLNLAAGSGVASFSDLVIQQAGTYTLTASDGSLISAVSGSFTISPDVAHQLAFERTTNDAVAGQTIPVFKVDVEDQYGNLEPGDTSTVTVGINTGPMGGSLTAGTLGVAATSGVAGFGDLIIQNAGTYTLAAMDGNLAQDISGSFTISPDTANKLKFENTNNNAISGQITPAFRVDVLDEFGNTVTADTSTVTISLDSDPPDQQFSSGTLSQAVVGGVATFNDLSIQGSGTYLLSANDGFLASALSNAFTVVQPLQVTANPANQAVFAGQSATFSATSANSSDTVQWQVNQSDGHGFTDIPGATTSTLTVNSVTAAESGYQYRAVFSNSVLTGSLASSAARLSVDTLTTAPTDTTVNAGQTASFMALSSNPAGTDTVQWQVNTNDGNGFLDISGATGTTLTISNATVAADGYLYQAVFSNAGYPGSLTTNPVRLSVDRVTASPSNASATAFQTVTFSAASSNPLGTDLVQWQVNANDGAGFKDITGATSTTLTINGITVPENGYEYQAVFTNPAYSGTLITSAATLSVSQAHPVVTWTNPGDISYGTALSATQLDATANVPGTFTYSPAAGTVLQTGQGQTLSVTFTPSDAIDYKTTTATTTINVNPAAGVIITWANPGDITYGTALSATQLDATANVPGTSVYNPPAGTVLGAGQNQTLSVTFTPDDTADYTTATTTVTINVKQATPTITWANPSDITYGSALSGTQLDASTPVAGSFSYTPAAGTVLGAGQKQTLSVTFTPTDTADYSTATATVTINVKQATPTITWGNPADITYGTALGSTQLDASASVAGSYAYTPAAGTVLQVGSNQTLSVTFTPTDTADYTSATASATINVTAAPLTITPSTGQSKVYGAAVPPLTFGVGGLVNGDSSSIVTAALGTTATASSVVGSYVFTLGSLNAGLNYQLILAANSPLFAVTPATPSFANVSAPVITYGTASTTISGQLQANAGPNPVPGGETVQITVGGLSESATLDSSGSFSSVFASGSLIPGASPYTIAFSYTGDANFNAAPGTSTLVVYVPAITVATNPTSQTAGNGETVTFTAGARGFPAPSVQWLVAPKGSANFQPVQNNPSATSAALTLTAVSSENGNQYEAMFSNAGGSATSKSATLTVAGLVPTLISSPTNQTATAGKPVTFTAQASASPTPTAQWQMSVDNGNTWSNIAGGAAGKLTFTAQPGDNNFQYRAAFSNRFGTVYSSAATLTVTSAATTPPVITAQPAGSAGAVNAGQHVTLKAAAGAAGAVQWQMSSDGVTFTGIAGATSTTYTFTAQASQNNYAYRAVFTNPFGQTNTSAVTLAVNPTITTQPLAQIAYDGQTVTFTAAATGNAQPTVQWQMSSDGKNFTDITSATSTTLNFTASVADTGRHYRAIFTSTNGTTTTQTTSKAVVLTVHALPAVPVITLQPVGQTSIAGRSVTFTAAAVANPQITSIQWQVMAKGSGKFVNITGVNSGALTFVAQTADNGSQYRAVFSNGKSMTTSAAKLTLDVAPVVTMQPRDQNGTIGKPVTFSAAASASPAAMVQWQVSVDGGQTYTDIKGATGLKLTFTAQAGQNGNFYRAVFTNPVGPAMTAAALLTV